MFVYSLEFLVIYFLSYLIVRSHKNDHQYLMIPIG